MSKSEDKPKDSKQVLREQLNESMQEYRRSNLNIFLSAVTAGLEIGFSILLMGILYTVFRNYLPDDLLHLVTAFGYPLGFIFVIIGGSQLFTEQTSLAVMPVLSGRVGFKDLFRLWLVVFTGNIIGGGLFAMLITWIGPAMNIIEVEAFTHFAKLLTDPEWYVVLGSATLAGWLMGLLSWLLFTSQESLTRIAVVALITLIIGFGKLHHCIVGSVEILCAMLSQHDFNAAVYGQTMLFSVIGNIIGGAFFVAVLKYSTIKS
ncbi:formate/nitrite transporter family protein [Cryomorpha ignava]|uniref:Formate/nitrite transporter family protein n=1 Tax=Cryomorpha ignava TaxID=101383 RepID=A0A7K3WNR2_9FLAO|nr:formate/nitrite transporter family protein [Cryomorpha ignava]NEN23290.1 formate/nitrite transporter family protein [Cryomorpha ignava]